MKWLNDREVTRNLMTGKWPVFRKAEELWVERAAVGNPADRILVIETHEGVYLGNTGLHKIDYVSGVYGAAWSRRPRLRPGTGI